MRVFSMFSGVGGFDIAVKRAGHEIVGACEIDRYARDVYARHFPGIEIHEDATKIDPRKLPDFDLLVAGFPCQPFSNAEGVAAFRMPEAHSFLKSLGCSKPSGHAIYCLRTSEAFYLTTRGTLCERSSESLTGWGMTRNGACMTLRGGSRRAESESSLSDILEPPERVPEKYYLSEKALRSLIMHREKQMKNGNNFSFVIKTPDQKSRTLQARDGEGGHMQYVGTLKQVGHIGKNRMAERVYDPNGKARPITSGAAGREP